MPYKSTSVICARGNLTMPRGVLLRQIVTATVYELNNMSLHHTTLWGYSGEIGRRHSVSFGDTTRDTCERASQSYPAGQ